MMHKGFLDMIEHNDCDIAFNEAIKGDALLEKCEYVLNNYEMIKNEIIEKKEKLCDMIRLEVGKVRTLLEKNEVWL